MYPALQQTVKSIAENIYHGNVLEIGSYNVNGMVRPYFNQAITYIGVDMMAGDNVDVVVNSHDLLSCYVSESFDTVICLETLEHDVKFWITVDVIKKLTKVGGNIIISTPTFGFPYHAYPYHPYLFSMDAYDYFIMDGLRDVKCYELRDTANQPGILGHGVK